MAPEPSLGLLDPYRAGHRAADVLKNQAKCSEKHHDVGIDAREAAFRPGGGVLAPLGDTALLNRALLGWFSASVVGRSLIKSGRLPPSPWLDGRTSALSGAVELVIAEISLTGISPRSSSPESSSLIRRVGGHGGRGGAGAPTNGKAGG